MIGLSLRFCFTQPVEIEPGLSLNRRGCGEIEDRPRAFLDRAQRPHPCPPHHACIHVSRGVKAGDRDTSTFERSPEIYWPTDRAPVIRRLEDGINEFSELRWGFPPARPKGPPVINFRSEGRRFPVGRCLVPASHFLSSPVRNRQRQSGNSRRPARDWFCFAGLWRPMAADGEAFTLLTTEPSPDIA